MENNKKILNRSQESAIKHNKGPLLVVAGAGSGKTTVITERIVNLVKQNLAIPSEILALTFTEKAANEMQERVDIAMPYGYAEMWISTFHGFCDRVLRDEALAIGLPTNYSLLSTAEAIQLARRHIFDFDLEYFRPVGNPTKFVQAMLTHFSRLQDEDVTPEQYLKWSKNQKSKMNSNNQEDKLETAKWWELAKAYKQYDKLKADGGFFDFGDLIVKTLLLFRSRPNILKKYQGKFKYVLIDEFQDTNFAQFELAMLLAGKRANITVVGDDDQSVYRFRGAAISNILQFRKRFPKAKTVVLTENYRTYQQILDSAYSLIQHNNPDRLEIAENIDKRLVSKRKGVGEVNFIHTKSSEQEAQKVAEEISRLVESGDYDYSDFAILVRANSQADPFIAALGYLGIPCQFLGPEKLFEQPEIIELVSYLKVLVNQEDSQSLYQVLSMPEMEIDQRDISQLLAESKKTHKSLWIVALESLENENLEDKTTQDITRLMELVENHATKTKNFSTGRILYEFLEGSGILSNLLSPSSERSLKRATNIGLFFEKIKKYESSHRGSNIFEVIDWLDLVSDLGDSPRAAETDWTAENAVNILTVHSAKGLEFPIVFMVNLVHLRFPSTNRAEPIPIPEALIKETLPSGDFHLQEERRLFYVGMTRARDRLYLTAADYYSNESTARARKPSQFIFEALGDSAATKQTGVEETQQLSLLNFAQSDPPDFVSEQPLDVHYLSYSQIDTFRLCPLHYRLSYLLKIPTAPSASLSLGNSVHNTLHGFLQQTRLGEKPVLGNLVDLLDKNWINEGYESRAHERKAFEAASSMLRDFFKNQFPLKKEIISLEQKFSVPLKIKGESPLRIGGKIDRVDALPGGRIEIIDYKTGNAPKEGQKDVDRDLQLTFYALVATKSQEAPFGKKPEEIKLTLWFLGENKKFTTTRTADQLASMEREIFKTRNEIQTSDFSCSGHPYCERCEYKTFCRAKIK